MHILSIIALSVLSAFGVYGFVPLSVFDVFHTDRAPIAGSTITTILGSDTITSSRAVINTNFANLNTDKIQAGDTVATLTVTALTTSGITQNGSATSTFAGGIDLSRLKTSATSTFTNGLVIEGGCLLFQGVCLGATTVTGVSNSDSTLTISPTSGNVVASLNLSKANTWLNATVFTATTTFNASSRLSNAIVFRNIPYSFPPVITGTSTVLSTDANGALTWNTVRSLSPRDSAVKATTTSTTVAGTATETTYDATGTMTLAAHALGANGTLKLRATISDLDHVAQATADNSITFRFKLGGTTICQIDAASATSAGADMIGFVDCTLAATGATNTQIAQGVLMAVATAGGTSGAKTAVYAGTATIDTTAAQQITLTADWAASNAGNTVTITSLVATVY